MKKLLFTLICLFLICGLFAETGYAGCKWGTHKSGLQLSETLAHSDNPLWNTTEAKRKPILGTQTTVYYHFSEDFLYGCSYTIDVDLTKTLRSKLQNFVAELEIESTNKTEWIDTLFTQRYITDKTNNADINAVAKRESNNYLI